MFFFFKQKTAYERRISDWSSDVCSSDLRLDRREIGGDDLGAAAERTRLRHRLLGGRAADAGDVGPRLGQRERDALADSGIGAGDDRDAVRKVEGIGHRAYANWQMSRTFMSV